MGTQPYSPSDDAASTNIPAGFTRPVIATVMLILLLALFFSAGFWQLDRAEQKRAVMKNYGQALNAAAVTELVSDEQAADLRFHTFKLKGVYLPEHQVLLDNMTEGGANGYQVLTPFKTDSGHVLVNRGWVAANTDRRVLPDIPVANDVRTVVARLNDLPAPGLLLTGQSAHNADWPQRLLFPDRQQLEQALSLKLPNYQLQLDPAEPDGYLRNWQAVGDGPEKHLGYALQWFSFAALAVIFYAILIYQWWRSRTAFLSQQLTNDAP